MLLFSANIFINSFILSEYTSSFSLYRLLPFILSDNGITIFFWTKILTDRLKDGNEIFDSLDISLIDLISFSSEIQMTILFLPFAMKFKIFSSFSVNKIPISSS